MITGILRFALLVRDYDEALAFYCGKLGFRVVEDTQLGSKRWVRVAAGADELLLVEARSEEEAATVGRQAAGRVLLYVRTDNLAGDYARLGALGVDFTETPRSEAWGKVVVLRDLYGNRIDLIEPVRQSP